MLEKLSDMQEDLDKNFVMNNKEDYIEKQQQAALLTEKINQESIEKMVTLQNKEKKLKKSMKNNYDEIQNYVDH